MPVLAIETTTLVSSAALAEEGQLIAELTIQTKKTHSETLMPHIAELLAAAKLKKEELTGIAVSLGPGSFTGIRIGLATAKALAYGLERPLIGVPTLDALAYNCPVPGVVLAPMLDAQKGNVYQAVYRWQEGALTTLIPARVAPHDQALDDLAAFDCPALVLGEAVQLFPEAVASRSHFLTPAQAHVLMPRAGSVAVLGAHLLAQGRTGAAEELTPIYIRRSEAEVLWEKRHGAGS